MNILLDLVPKELEDIIINYKKEMEFFERIEKAKNKIYKSSLSVRPRDFRPKHLRIKNQ